MGRTVPGEDASARLRAGGLRATAQRGGVLVAVAALGHATPEQVHEAVGTDVDLSTVYRALDVLAAGGLVQHTHLGHGAPTWSLADGEDHIHLVCSGCHAVQEIPGHLVADLKAELRRAHGFDLDVGHLSLSGHCLQCRTNGDETP
jgi:Fur family ferric uptake transcriptional regulator